MSFLTFKNKVQDFPAQFDITQNGDMSGVVSADIGGSVIVPTVNSYTVYAVVTLDDNTYTTGKTMFQDRSQNVLAQCKQRDGTISFELECTPGSFPDTITLRNTTRSSVQFFILKNDSGLQTAKVCDPFNQAFVSTRDIYSIKAIVNGITTEDVETSDPNAILATTANNVEGPKGTSASLNVLPRAA